MKKTNWITTLLLSLMLAFVACTESAEQATDQPEEEMEPRDEVVQTAAMDSSSAAADTAAMDYDSAFMEDGEPMDMDEAPSEEMEEDESNG